MDRFRSFSMIACGCFLSLVMHAASAANLEKRLLEAASAGDPEDAVEALEVGAEIDARNEDGLTPLMVAAQH
ncbi:ankyrin repeat domain-containing protein, partial [Halorhodospira sp. 9621]|nr:ankyrin repeat domain-containing protein [Halorhodospira sp. 9621]